MTMIGHQLVGHKRTELLSSCRSTPTMLTPREAAVLKRVVCGDSNGEIARHLRIQEQTVKNHVSVLLQKLHVRNRVQLAVLVAHQWPELVERVT